MIYDYLIIGAGVAGLNAARLIPKDKKVLVLCKKEPWECNTYYAQGGIAATMDESDVASHIEDTLKAGVHHNNLEAVEALSHNSNPLPHVLILTAIVVGVATTSVGLALIVRIKEAYGSTDEDDIHDMDDNEDFPLEENRSIN